MSADRGPIRTYEIIWKSGCVEQIQAHQVLVPHSPLFGEPPSARDDVYTFHGEIDGQWLLILTASAADILSIRLVLDQQATTTNTEGGAS